MPCLDHGCRLEDNDQKEEHAQDVESKQNDNGFLLPGSYAHYAPDLSLEPTHLVIRLSFDLNLRHVTGSVTTRFKCNRDGARTVVLNAERFFKVTVESGDENVSLQWTYNGSEITITFGEGVPYGQERTAVVSYSVIDPINGLFFSAPNAAYPYLPLFVYSDHETERARYWLPCVDFPTVRTTVSFYLTRDASLKTVAGGVFMGDMQNEDGTCTSNWELRHRCPSYLINVGVGELQILEDGGSGEKNTPIAYVSSKLIPAEDLRNTFSETKGMLKWLEQRLGTQFPFDKYWTFLTSNEMGGAMENMTITTFGGRFWLDEIHRPELIDNVNRVIIHEMAHTYFGDSVVIRYFEHAWLKESWARFIEQCWNQENRPRADAEYHLLSMAKAYQAETESYVRPIVTREYNSSWQLFDAHTYPGGAWRLHMLRHKCGEGAFWAGVRNYLSLYAGRTAETDDFRKCLEDSSGLNLTKFFDSWLYGRGYPHLSASLEYSGENGRAVVTLQQTQESTAKKIGLFDIEVEIEIVVKDGEGGETKQSQTVNFIQKGLTVNRAVAVFTGLKAKPLEVRIDPKNKVLHKLDFNPGEDILNTTLTKAENVFLRVWAGSELAKIGSRSALNKIDEALKAEPFFAVRFEVAKAVARLSSNGIAIGLFAEILKRETHPRALPALASLATDIADYRVRQAILAQLDRSDIRYTARANLLEALGYQRGASEKIDEIESAINSDFDRLVVGANDEGFQSIVRSGAIRGLAALRDKRAYEVLKKRVAYGAENWDSRPTAIIAYASAAYWQSDTEKLLAAERIASCLSEAREKIIFAAISGLVKLESKKHARHIRNAKTAIAVQDHISIDKKLNQLESASDTSATSKLQKEVDDLQQKYRKLEEKVQDLTAKQQSMSAAPPPVIPAPATTTTVTSEASMGDVEEQQPETGAVPIAS